MLAEFVVGLARRKDRLDQLAKKLSGKKGKLFPVKTDLTKEEDILNAFKWTKENLGPIHILINNAGYAETGYITDGDTELWNKIFQLNVIGLSIATREAVKDMKANNVDGHIIHINSLAGHRNLSPGLVDTEILPPYFAKNVKEYYETGRIIEAEHIADGVVYALSTPPHVQVII
ncbi:hypothetical protein NQ314_015270 [Rhamnusium bicolor]|uniref:Farnesol dehydrogenase-like n=1 Tax=Rhamnusium bicolor TaxID=1586634 RepID=A0AAV8WZA7_9CUCU|nr:hypothetical protein NQ314_015270 [Rhamnusium bicolor]